MSYAKIDQEDIDGIRIIFVPQGDDEDKRDLEPLESGACSACHVEIESNLKYGVKCPVCGGNVWLT